MAGTRRRPSPASLLALLLVAVPFLQAPGRTSFDTKLDLTQDPWGFLQRALHLWDPQDGLGQLQNQAFGYLFPMGPFFGVAHSAGLPGWVTQRLWAGLLLGLGFLGARRLARLLGLAEPAAVVAGLLYALAPRLLTVLGPISAEALPAVLLPWALLPLVREGDGSPRRAALRSSVVVLCMGAANATVTLAVLPALFLWVLLRPHRRRLLGWLTAGTVLACAWWLVPLVLMGAYSPPFLGWVESAADTTRPVGLLPALRGVDHWVAYVSIGGDPVWPAGHALTVVPALLLATGLVAVAGLGGLLHRAMPVRGYLSLLALVGLGLLVLGHTGDATGPFAGSVQQLLDTALAPLRNVHKFDPLLRLPIALGAGHAMTVAGAALRRRGRPGLPAPYAAALLVFVTALPLAVPGFRPGPTFRQLPAYWQQAAGYLDRHGTGSTLVVPGAGFVVQTWGRTIDEPLQPLASSPWAVRGQVPLGSAGSTRLMDSVEDVLLTGRGSPALAALLARSGVGQLVVRNDLDVRIADTVPQARVHAALAGSPGLTRAAAFGRQLPAQQHGLVIGSPPSYPAIEVYDVAAAPASPVTAGPLAGAVLVGGGPEGLLPLLESGRLPATAPAVLTGDPAVPTGSAVATDSLRRRQRSFGQVHRSLGETRSVADGWSDGRVVHDVLGSGSGPHQVVADYGPDVAAVTASTSAADGVAPGGADLSGEPFAALDGDPATAWRSASYDGPRGQWWQVRFTAARDLTGLRAVFAADAGRGPAVTRVEVTTDAGSVTQSVPSGALAVPAGRTRSLRLTVIGVQGSGSTGNVGLTEVTVPGLVVRRTLRLPADLPADAFDFSLDPEPVPQCVAAGTATLCDDRDAGLAGDQTGLARSFELRGAASLVVSGSALPRPGDSTFRLLGPLRPVQRTSASSTLGSSPLVRPDLAFDGDPATAWVPARDDPHPTLHLAWPTTQTLTGLRLVLPRSVGLSVPVQLRLTTPAGSFLVSPDQLGRATFPPVRTDSVDVSFPAVQTVVTSRPLTGFPAASPLAVAELEFPSTPRAGYVPDPAGPTGAPCGFGPQVTVDGSTVQTTVEGTVRDLLESRPLRFTACGPPIRLGPGEHTVRVTAGPDFVGRSVLLAGAPPAPSTGGRPVAVTRWTATDRAVRLAAGAPALLTVHENRNAGWVATLRGDRLRAVTVDGWQQGWVVPAGEGGEVRLRFRPDRPYRAALLGGALLAGVLLLLTALAGRAGPPAWRLRPRRVRPVPAGAAALGVAVLLCGPWGLVAVLPCVLLARGRTRALQVLGPASLAAALGAALAAAETGTAVQVLSVLAVSCLVAAQA